MEALRVVRAGMRAEGTEAACAEGRVERVEVRAVVPAERSGD